MPSKPLRPCRVQGCRNLCRPGEAYCAEHIKQQNREYNKYQRDKDSQMFYQSSVWRNTRKQKLQEQPCCEECLRKGIITPATLVDHIVPIKQGGSKLDFRNLQSLCWNCHSRKSIEEGSRFG